MRFGSLIKLKPEYEEQYIILHKHTFPGVLDRIQKSNIRNYSIFLRDGLLFSYFEYIGNDYMGDMAKIGQDPVTQEWWKLTDPMQEPLETRKQGEWWASMEEIFHGGKKHMSGREAQRKAFMAPIGEDSQEDQKNFSIYQIQKSPSQNIQKCSIYRKDTSLFAYFEYVGQKIDNEIERFLEGLKVHKVLHWIEMKEVFHTD
jgi:L-rhamnose mutarotase